MRRLIAAAALLLSLLLASRVQAEYLTTIRYTVTDIGSLGPGNVSLRPGYIFPNAINNYGQVVGGYRVFDDVTHTSYLGAFLYDGGTMMDLGNLGGSFPAAEAYDINDHGQIVGYSHTSDSAARAFLYQNGGMIDLGTFGGPHSYAYAINNAGQIAGSAARAFRYENGVMTDLGTLGGTSSRGYGINESGHVVGESTVNPHNEYSRHVFYHDGDKMRDLGTLGVFTDHAYSVNDSGQIVGWYGKENGNEGAFLYDGSSFTDLGTLGGGSIKAFSINNLGHIVGYGYLPNDEYRAFISDGSGLIDITTLLNTSDEGWTIQYAYDINELGQIVGIGLSPSGDERAVLLNPTVVTLPQLCRLPARRRRDGVWVGVVEASQASCASLVYRGVARSVIAAGAGWGRLGSCDKGVTAGSAKGICDETTDYWAGTSDPNRWASSRGIHVVRSWQRPYL